MMFQLMHTDMLVKENLAIDDNTINVPGKGSKGNTGTVFVRGVKVFNSTSATTGPGEWLQKKDQTYLTEYVDRLTGPSGGQTAQDVTGFPKYYAMFGGATAVSDTTSGGLYVAPYARCKIICIEYTMIWYLKV